MRLDLTAEERQEYIEAHTEEFKQSSGGVIAEARYRARLVKAGVDRDEIDYLVRTNRP